MKYNKKDIEGSRREFLFEIPVEEVKKTLDKVYKEINNTVLIPGFRKGKAPREILEKYHGGEAMEKAARNMVGDSYSQALKESDTVPMGLPQISDVQFTDGKEASYKAVVDVRPEVDLLGYDKLLSSGACQGAWEVTVEAATPRAIDKVKSAGGKVTLPKAE